MLKKIVTLVPSIFLLINISIADHKVVYGDDNRVEPYQFKDRMFYELARSTAAMIAPTNLQKNGSGYKIIGKTLEAYGVCKTERFSQQMTAANCTGFLVGKDLLVTAGHCIKSQDDCLKYKWVFDYRLEDESITSVEVSAQNVYSCKSIVDRTLDEETQNDYALIKLDRAVKDREPLKYRKTGKIKKGTDVLVIGHPTGLPAKIADGAKVRRSMDKNFFYTNLDTFGGNSGSPVFNAKTGVVEGILVRGEQDYVQDSSGDCSVVNRCALNSCKGEEVTRITNIKTLK